MSTYFAIYVDILFIPATEPSGGGTAAHCPTASWRNAETPAWTASTPDESIHAGRLNCTDEGQATDCQQTIGNNT